MPRNHFIGQGHNHEVYMFGEHHVIKLPLLDSKITYSQALRSVEFFQQHFGEFIAKTEIGKDSYDSYTITQEYVPGVTLGEYIKNKGMNPKIRNQIQRFSERAWNIYKMKGITFDILGRSNTSVEVGNPWKQCKNIITTPDFDIKFIDTVDASRSIRQNRFINNLAQSILPGRKNRVQILTDLYSQSLTL